MRIAETCHGRTRLPVGEFGIRTATQGRPQNNGVPVKLLRMRNADETMLSIRLRLKDLGCYDSVCPGFRQTGGKGILSCSGLLNGIFGTGDLRHVACWQTSKKIDHIEETDDRGVTILRDRERFTQSLTLIYADGRTAELSEETDAECAPTSGPA